MHAARPVAVLSSQVPFTHAVDAQSGSQVPFPSASCVPAAAEARRATPAGPHFAAWIVDELVGKYGLPRPSVVQWLDEGQIALLLDGLDETESGRRAEVVEAINAFHREHPVPLVVACRDSEYAAIGKRLRFS